MDLKDHLIPIPTAFQLDKVIQGLMQPGFEHRQD